MKKIFTMFLAAAAPVAVSAQVAETPATLALEAGGNPAGYVQGANEQGVIFSTSPGGRGQLVEYSKIRSEGDAKLIRFNERAESLAQPRALFAAGKYDEAAAAFGAVAQNYAIILGAPKNFASEAAFYQMESIRRAGKYALLPPLIASPAGQSIENALGEPYLRIHEFHKLYSLLAERKWDELTTALSAFEEPAVGDMKLLSSPNFKALPSSQLADLHYIRGKAYDAAGEKEKALNDFYAAMSLAYANERVSAQLAMGAAMVLQKDDPLLARENKQAVGEMQSLAYMYGKRFGTDGMPEEIKKFAVRPAMVRPPAPAAEAEPASDEAAPESAPESESPEASEAEKGKGKKGKGKKE